MQKLLLKIEPLEKTQFFYNNFSVSGGGDFPPVPTGYATANMPNFPRVRLLESRLNWSIAKYHNTKFFAVGILFLYKQGQITFRNKNIKKLNWDVQTDFGFLILLCFCRVSIFQCQIISMSHTLQLAFVSFSILSLFPLFHVEFSICGIFSANRNF